MAEHNLNCYISGCDYKTTNSRTLSSHLFKKHPTWIHDELYRYYGEAVAFTPPLQILMPDAKNLYVCLCCKNTWTSLHVYHKHVVKSEGCHPTNQLLALEKLFGKKLDAAKNTTTNFSIVKKQEESIGKLLDMIIAQKEEIEKHLGRIKNLENRVFKLGCCKCAGNSTEPPKNAILPPTPQPKPAPLPNQVLSDDEDESSSEEEEPPPKSTKPELRCLHAAKCGDTAATREFDLMDCKKCKIPVCRPCVRRAGANSFNPYCSPKCRGV